MSEFSVAVERTTFEHTLEIERTTHTYTVTPGVRPDLTFPVTVTRPQFTVNVVPKRAGSLDALKDDLHPQLGGDLDLNGFQILGTLEDGMLVLDGGLIDEGGF